MEGPHLLVDATWQAIEPAVKIILGDDENQSLTSEMYARTYTTIYNYCTSTSTRKQPTIQTGSDGNTSVKLSGGELYYKVQKFLKEYLDRLDKRDDETFLEFYIRAWSRFTIGAARLNDIFEYINRYWVNKERADGHREIYDISSLCLLSWRDYKFSPNLNVLMDQIMSQITEQRINKTASTGSLNIVIKSFVSLGFDTNDLKKVNLSVYIQDFEKRFIADTHEFYRVESNEYIKNHGVVNYLAKAEQRIDEEMKRLEELNEHTRRLLNDTLNECLIKNHADLIRAELPNLLDQSRLGDIRRIHVLLRRIPSASEPLLAKFQAYVRDQGFLACIQLKEETEKAAIAAAAAAAADSDSTTKKPTSASANGAIIIDPKTYINTLIGVYEKFQNVVKVSFENDGVFVKALDSGCQEYINGNCISQPTRASRPRIAEYLAKYADELLKKKNSSDEGMSVDNLMTIFNFVNDKDTFEVWYRRLLSKRLMSGISPEEEEQEEFIVQKLKTANSTEYTNKITNMFNDIRTSKDLSQIYKDSLSGLEDSKEYIGDIEARILDAASWREILKTSNETFELPKQLLKSQERFIELYTKKHSAKQLQWVWNRSRADVKANISKPGKPPFSFTVTLFQLSILLLFNDNNTLSTQKILEATALSPDVLKANLIPFVKNKLLVQSPVGEAMMLKSNTTYTIVKEYTSKRIKVNFASSVKLVDTKQEEKETEEEIRKGELQSLKACIVRVMKARKTLKHEQLIAEVVKQLRGRFSPTIPAIKGAIEDLIEDSYLARDDNNGYEYLS